MNWDAIGAVGEIVGALAVLTSILYLAVQIRQNTSSIRSSSYQGAVSSISEVTLLLANNAEIARIAKIGLSEDGNDLDAEEEFRFGMLLTGIFRNYENYWFQHECGVMDDHLWIGVKNAMLGYYNQPAVKRWWKLRSSIYSSEFEAFLNEQSSEI